MNPAYDSNQKFQTTELQSLRAFVAAVNTAIKMPIKDRTGGLNT
jgi:hypothetical protein